MIGQESDGTMLLFRIPILRIASDVEEPAQAANSSSVVLLGASLLGLPVVAYLNLLEFRTSQVPRCGSPVRSITA